jgi:hypothetical protein
VRSSSHDDSRLCSREVSENVLRVLEVQRIGALAERRDERGERLARRALNGGARASRQRQPCRARGGA